MRKLIIFNLFLLLIISRLTSAEKHYLSGKQDNEILMENSQSIIKVEYYINNIYIKNLTSTGFYINKNGYILTSTYAYRMMFRNSDKQEIADQQIYNFKIPDVSIFVSTRSSGNEPIRRRAYKVYEDLILGLLLLKTEESNSPFIDFGDSNGSFKLDEILIVFVNEKNELDRVYGCIGEISDGGYLDVRQDEYSFKTQLKMGKDLSFNGIGAPVFDRYRKRVMGIVTEKTSKEGIIKILPLNYASNLYNMTSKIENR